ncbi:MULTISPECIES: glutamate 5-kinase [Corallincola]|uniref:Glutamate 5-kinase n=3 Tax=Corallincola TaxID=1775176 RepID=A0A368NF60_9GAMM|nr:MULTISPECIES: glutamate 5-kinase [Corallincola]RCU49118.1 glutamate 5-kinase [Corallincola holothuriorum]TAA47569.1 glutamate 5-kinase [Corallincola spongiicola]TCI05251.1 glutamate 5-kinase [Corallincola luteus]
MGELASKYPTIVVKLGTSVLTGGSQLLDKAHMVELTRQIAALHKAGCEVVLVSSGAIAAGREHLNFPTIADNVASKQMLAAVGQSQLILTWESLFNLYGLHVGQMLLTRADLEDRERYLNAQDTLKTLLKHRIVPVINENDAVATAEIKVGDNDNLSALAAILADADLLLLLTDQPGLFTADPRSNPDAKLIREVETIDETLRSIAGDSVSGLGTGGMATKLQAADVARRAGIDVIIAAGHHPDVITGACGGESVGTRFVAHPAPLDARKQWLFAGPKQSGSIHIDAGAVKAICNQGSSLLPAGIVALEGSFSRGALVALCDEKGCEVARGISRYGMEELKQIMGCHSEQISERLQIHFGPVVVHRDDLVLI